MDISRLLYMQINAVVESAQITQPLRCVRSFLSAHRVGVLIIVQILHCDRAYLLSGPYSFSITVHKLIH